MCFVLFFDFFGFGSVWSITPCPSFDFNPYADSNLYLVFFLRWRGPNPDLAALTLALTLALSLALTLTGFGCREALTLALNPNPRDSNLDPDPSDANLDPDPSPD